MQESSVIAEQKSLGLFQRKLSNYSPLTTADMNALDALPRTRRVLDAGTYLLREGEPSHTCPVLVSGFAFRHKTTARGGRQIVAVKMPGDPLDFQSLYVARADHYLQVICPLLSGPKLMVFWMTKETWNAEQEASPGRDYRQAA